MESDLKTLYFNVPPVTRYYLTGVFAMAFILTYIKTPYIFYLFLDYDLVFKKIQIWRLVTNVIIVGKFSFNFLFFLIFSHSVIGGLEKKYIESKRYAEFIMILIYNGLFLHLVKIIGYYCFGFNPGFSICHELLFALLYLDSKRDPEKLVSLYGLVLKSKKYL